MTSTVIDYTTVQFELPVIEKIHGESSYESLKNLKKQLKTNALSLSSDLGGGEHGHLGLVLTPEEYPFFVDEYELPAQPGSLNIPDNTPHIAALTMRYNHK